MKQFLIILSQLFQSVHDGAFPPVIVSYKSSSISDFPMEILLSPSLPPIAKAYQRKSSFHISPPLVGKRGICIQYCQTLIVTANDNSSVPQTKKMDFKIII